MLSSIRFAFKYGGMVLKLGPIFISVVRAVEAIREGTVSGEQKKEIAMKTLGSILSTFGYSITPNVIKIIDHGVELVVAALTFTGELRSKGVKAVATEIPASDVPTQVLEVSQLIISNKAKLEEIKTLMTK
jgi:hypothetical protein